jgi:hypothetical protein
LGVGNSQDVTWPLSGSLPDGDYTITAAASTTQAGSEAVHVELVHHDVHAVETVLASGDGTLTTAAPALSGTFQLVLHAAALVPYCGDGLIVRVQHPSGTQPLFAFELTLDLP